MFVSFANRRRERIWFALIGCLLALIGTVFFEISDPGILLLSYAVIFVLVLTALYSASYLWPKVVRLGLTEREAADAILAQFPGPAQVQASRAMFWATGIAFFGLFLSPIEFNSSGLTYHYGWAVEAFFFVLLPCLGYLSIFLAPKITVDAEGLTVKNKKMLWAEITAFETVKPGIFYGDVVYFHVGGGLSTLPYPDVFAPSTITALMTEWRSRALALAQEKAERSKKILTETASL